jgi:hypothetical protein
MTGWDSPEQVFECSVLVLLGVLCEIVKDPRLALLAWAEPVTADVDGRRVVQQSVQNGRGEHVVGRDTTPLTEGLAAIENDVGLASSPRLCGSAD